MNVKKHCDRFTGLLQSIIKVTFFGAPSAVLAMGGEAIAGGLMTLAFWFIVWLIALPLSFIPKTEPWSMDRLMLWVIRLGFPVWFAWAFISAINVDPKAVQLRHEQNELLANKALQKFNSLCEQHAPHATKILGVVNYEIPKDGLNNSPAKVVAGSIFRLWNLVRDFQKPHRFLTFRALVLHLLVHLPSFRAHSSLRLQ